MKRLVLAALSAMAFVIAGVGSSSAQEIVGVGYWAVHDNPEGLEQLVLHDSNGEPFPFVGTDVSCDGTGAGYKAMRTFLHTHGKGKIRWEITKTCRVLDIWVPKICLTNNGGDELCSAYVYIGNLGSSEEEPATPAFNLVPLQ